MKMASLNVFFLFPSKLIGTLSGKGTNEFSGCELNI